MWRLSCPRCVLPRNAFFAVGFPQPHKVTLADWDTDRWSIHTVTAGSDMGEPGAPRRIKRTQPAAELGVREHGEFPSTGSVGLYWRLSNMVGKFLHRKKKVLSSIFHMVRLISTRKVYTSNLSLHYFSIALELTISSVLWDTSWSTLLSFHLKTPPHPAPHYGGRCFSRLLKYCL